MKKISLIAWGMVAAAMFAWILAAMFAWTIFAEESQRNWRIGDAEEAAARETAALRLHALARDTKNAREQLAALTEADVLGIANMIESVGKSTGVKIKINGAEPESDRQDASTKVQTLNAVNFLVETEGTFASLMHTASLFENLPAISVVQSLEFERLQTSDSIDKNKKPLWRLIARIKVMTTAGI